MRQFSTKLGRVCSLPDEIGLMKYSWQVFHNRLLIGRCFKGFVLPILEYCSAVWCSAADLQFKLPDHSNMNLLNEKEFKISKNFDRNKNPYKKLNTDLTKFPKILPRYIDASHKDTVVLSFFSYYILVVHLNISMVYIYIYIYNI